MRAHHLDLLLLLWAISYQEPRLVTDELAKFERTALLSSSELLGLLKTWHKPPRAHSQGTQSKGASEAVDKFVIDRAASILQQEMVAVGKYMRTNVAELSEEHLLSIKISELKEDIKKIAPTVWSLILRCSWTRRQEKENKLKDPETPVLFIIAITSYTRSNRNSLLQRLVAIYLKSCGTSAKAFDTLNALGISMSQKWVYGALEILSARQEAAMRVDISQFPWIGSHDNLNFRNRVFEQRSDHHSTFDSGTAGTIYIIKDPAAILKLEAAAAPRLAIRARDVLLQVLLATPGFDLASYEHRDHAALRPAPRPGQLCVDVEGNTTQYMLRTLHEEEASYEGNERVFEEWLRQVDITTPEKKKDLGQNCVIPWIGDQLTASRLRGITVFSCDDYNPFDSRDWLVPQPGFFHLVFAVEQSLHEQYYLTRAALGLVHAFEIMDRRGLQKTSTQGTFHHTFEEAFDHTYEARIRDLWCVAAGVSSLEELRSRSPEELCALAAHIHDNYASTLALSRHDALPTPAGPPKAPSDPLLHQNIMFARDAMDYHLLRDAIKCRDVQTMEDLLPRLLLRFLGSSNKNYAIEICELLQGLNKEWPDDLKEFIRKYCWLVNTGKRPDSWIPYDRAQEHNVGDIKYTFTAMGPSASWDYLEKTSASIPCQRNVKDHVEHEINHGARGKSHTSPAKEKDVSRLQEKYHEVDAHVAVPARCLASKDKAKDVMWRGTQASMNGRAYRRWAKQRVQRREFKPEDDNWIDYTVAQTD
ncbi:hypothetical protein C8T65DRAFT_745287 [Cerioporus squamosus]|nr:hypothetical protein C8T65DRAFT_745287 [Cerioporus squamosus]